MIPEQRDELHRNSQELRRDMTKEERHLWYDYLKKLPITVHRQFVIDEYILDFYIPCAKIAIEIDGEQHYKKENREYDERRKAFLAERGISVIRYDNRDINLKFEAVCGGLSIILKEWL